MGKWSESIWEINLGSKIIEDIKNGKTRGYSIEKEIDEKIFFLEYAIKKSGNYYVCYFFRFLAIRWM